MSIFGLMYYSYECQNAVVRIEMQDLNLVRSYGRVQNPGVTRFR